MTGLCQSIEVILPDHRRLVHRSDFSFDDTPDHKSLSTYGRQEVLLSLQSFLLLDNARPPWGVIVSQIRVMLMLLFIILLLLL